MGAQTTYICDRCGAKSHRIMESLKVSLYWGKLCAAGDHTPKNYTYCGQCLEHVTKVVRAAFKEAING
ncbi:hypothetical protein GCM10007895_06330 [Paraferrimonas sedimenticola]|uniref:Uncharacterized protein n=1 Tax=Paraferrimonas sedimenticola TaxID=375674 RepID=A0AA37RV09_9GAMM|nr:hypothetical protein GCM10007895_06330 [Paraferrimonas sedimenticola]